MLFEDWHEIFVDELLIAGGSGVLRGTWLESAHVARIESAGHLQDQVGLVLGHAELNQSRTQLFVRQLDILEVRFADGIADDSRSFGHIQVALAEQFVGLLALKLGVKKEFGNCGSDVLRGDDRGAGGQHSCPRP